MSQWVRRPLEMYHNLAILKVFLIKRTGRLGRTRMNQSEGTRSIWFACRTVSRHWCSKLCFPVFSAAPLSGSELLPYHNNRLVIFIMRTKKVIIALNGGKTTMQNSPAALGVNILSSSNFWCCGSLDEFHTQQKHQQLCRSCEEKINSVLPSMAGLYCDITLLASVGRETATNTISRQAILYSSSGLMFSARTQERFRHGRHGVPGSSSGALLRLRLYVHSTSGHDGR